MLLNESSSFLPSTAAPHVLVVDDVQSQRSAVSRALRAEGFLVTEAATGRDALSVAARTAFDAVVLEVHLPDLDGHELCRRLKAAAPGLLPVLNLSSTSTSADSRVRGLDAGADGYLTYPFDPNELRAAVSALVRLKRQESARLGQITANTLLHEALDGLPDHIALLNAAGEIIGVNQTWADFAGANGYAAGGTGVGVNYPSRIRTATGAERDYAHAAAQGIRDVLSSRTPNFEMDYPCHSPTTERWFRMTARRIVRPGPVAAIVTHVNRTVERLSARAEAVARIRAEEANKARVIDEALFRSLTERSLEFVSVLDANGQFKYVSPSVERSLGYAVEDLVGTHPIALVHPDDRETMLATYFALTTGGPGTIAEMLVRLRHKNGSWRYFEGGGQNLLHEPFIQGITSNARDVTERVNAQRVTEGALRAAEDHRRRLERERAHLATIFEKAPAFLAVARAAGTLD
jgi:PAS domain S-box-containing protein